MGVGPWVRPGRGKGPAERPRASSRTRTCDIGGPGWCASTAPATHLQHLSSALDVRTRPEHLEVAGSTTSDDTSFLFGF